MIVELWRISPARERRTMKQSTTKKVTITPKGSKTKTKAKVSPSWNEKDIHFDEKGRMVIRNNKLAGKILDLIQSDSEIVVIIPPAPIRNPHPPDPANMMCGCKRIKLGFDEESQINEFGKQGKLSLGLKA